jgi:cysteine desulfurase/selenocysteine lyase
MDELKKLISKRTKLIAVTHVSNTLGTINPVKEISILAKENNCKILIDAAQSIPHFKVNVNNLDCDFLVFSGHKIFAPTGVGILYVKKERFEEMKPSQGGGDMIKEVSFEKTTYNTYPHKFEAGTPNICGGIAFGTGLDYMNSVGFDAIASYEATLLHYATKELLKFEGMKIYGTTAEKTAVISFNIGNIHPYDIGVILDKLGIAVRTGHHCAQPIMDFYKIPGTIRASFSFYNTKEEIDLFITALKRAVSMLS